jgi:dynein heavy chain, axonemal
LQEWDGLDVRTASYKSSGTFIVCGTDDIQTVVDDQIVKVQAMNASPFVKPFKDRSTRHEAALQTLQDMLDAWLQCQATWLYLEPIFSSDDIFKQMPEEGEKFRTVDGTWREIMAATVAAPAVLALGRDAGTLERLNSCNGLLDEIQKGLAAYLEKKRLFFPRCGARLFHQDYTTVVLSALFSASCKPTNDCDFACSFCSFFGLPDDMLNTWWQTMRRTSFGHPR